MNGESSILLTDEQRCFAKELVGAGHNWRSCLSQHILASHMCDLNIDDVRCGYLAFSRNSGLPLQQGKSQAEHLR